MPELPEVQTVVSNLKPDVTGLTIVDVTIKNPNLNIKLDDSIIDILKNKKILGTYRRAKWPALVFDDGYLWMHLGMTGQILISSTQMALDKHVNLILHLSNGKYLVFKDPRRFGRIVFTTENIPPALNLGPEPLDIEFTGEVLYKSLQKIKKPIKVALMDGPSVAGVGNIYASEVLFDSKISPNKPSNKITLDESNIIVKNIKNILQNAIDAGGSTLRDYRKPDGSKGNAQNTHKVYNRTGQPCVSCGTAIAEKVQSGRTTFWCTTCQTD